MVQAIVNNGAKAGALFAVNRGGKGSSLFNIAPKRLLDLGVYVGTGNGVSVGNQADIAAFAAATGTSVGIIQTYLPQTLGWGELTTRASLGSWLSAWAGAPQKLMMGVPLCTALSGVAQNTLAQGAAGTVGSVGTVAAVFGALAGNLVALGFGNAILRLGWEQNIPPNAPSSPNPHLWGITSDADATNFAAFWQNVVTAMNAVSGAHFKYMWSLARAQDQNPDWGTVFEHSYPESFPGATYVDYIGVDIYDQSFNANIFPPSGVPNNTTTVAQAEQFWNQIVTGNSFGGTPTNIIALEDSVFESGGVGTIGHWTKGTNVAAGSGATNTQAPPGSTYSFEVIPTSTGFTNPRLNLIDGIVPGATYTFTWWVRAALTGKSWALALPWVSPSGAAISTSNPTVSGGPDNTTGWTTLTATATAPTNPITAKVSFSLSYTSGGATDIHYIGDVIIAGPLGSQGSLNWFEQFSQSQGPPMTIPEWAVMTYGNGSGLGDDPTFIENMYAWMVANGAVISSYFSQIASSGPGDDYNLIDGTFPLSLAAFKAQNWAVA